MKRWQRLLAIFCGSFSLLLALACTLPRYHPTRAYAFTRGEWTGHCWILHKDGHDYPIQIEEQNSTQEAWGSFDALDYDIVQFNRERFVLVGELERFPTGRLGGTIVTPTSPILKKLIGYSSWLKGHSPDTADMPAYHFRLHHWYLKPPSHKAMQHERILGDIPLKYKTLTKLKSEHFDENFLMHFPNFDPRRYEIP